MPQSVLVDLQQLTTHPRNSVQQGCKVFREHNDWWEEFRLYDRKDGKVVKEGDDLMAATRYAVMSLRHASTKGSYASFRRKINYPNLGLY